MAPKSLTLLAALCTAAATLPATAVPITTLFNTGVDAGGAVVANGTLGDLHYSLVSVPSGSSTIRALTSASGWPIQTGVWLADNTLSRWIGPNNDSDLNGPVGNYRYRTTFDLTGLDPLTAAITGRLSTDNNNLNVYLNGSPLGINTSFASFTSWTAFAINSGFVAGLNTLEFELYNGGGPTGLRVEMTGTASLAVPDGGVSLGLLGLGLGSVAFLRRPRR